jgi:hypothetical protein
MAFSTIVSFETAEKVFLWSNLSFLGGEINSGFKLYKSLIPFSQ